MKDILFKYDYDSQVFDIDIDIKIDESLENLISMLLFTDARCEDYELPKFEISKRGFWADSLDNITTGSKLWLLSRAKKSDETLNEIKSHCSKALQTLIDEKIVSKIEIQVCFVKNQTQIIIKIHNLKGKVLYNYAF